MIAIIGALVIGFTLGWITFSSRTPRRIELEKGGVYIVETTVKRIM